MRRAELFDEQLALINSIVPDVAVLTYKEFAQMMRKSENTIRVNYKALFIHGCISKVDAANILAKKIKKV